MANNPITAIAAIGHQLGKELPAGACADVPGKVSVLPLVTIAALMGVEPLLAAMAAPAASRS